ncbi:hypothetical protein GCM10009808_20180 [Microbacterium sediminicola]|uniref:Uncharacterized protein n=1 Tax=Microbacterium sediminicola TaxID=415210 RepID=A0ABN2IC37_9MICO
MNTEDTTTDDTNTTDTPEATGGCRCVDHGRGARGPHEGRRGGKGHGRGKGRDGHRGRHGHGMHHGARPDHGRNGVPDAGEHRLGEIAQRAYERGFEAGFASGFTAAHRTDA